MKRYLYILLVMVLPGVGLTSCVFDREGIDPQQQTELATLTLSTPAQDGGTRSGAATDDDIDFFRIMMFRKSSGELAYNRYYDMSVTTNPITLEVILTEYDFVFIANEHTDSRLHGYLESLTATATLASVDAQYFSSESFGRDLPIPAAGMVRGVKISGGDKVTVGSKTITGAWDISEYLIRLAVRVDFKIVSSRLWYWNAMEEVTISNVPSRVYLFGQRANGTVLHNDGQYESVPRSIDPEDFVRSTSGSSYVGTYDRLILPSSSFPAKTDPSYAYLFRVGLQDGGTHSATLGINEPSDYTLPRNNHIKFNGTFNDSGTINFTLQVVDWLYFETHM